MRALQVDGGVATLCTNAAEPASPGPYSRGPFAIVRPTRVAVGELDVAFAASAGDVIPGREFVGVIESISPRDVGATLRVGQRVVADPFVPCAACDLCRSGLSDHCASGRRLGIDAPGALAERVLVPLTALHAAPRDVDDDGAVFAAALSRALRASRLAHAEEGGHATVLGDGAAALLTAQALSVVSPGVRVIGTRPKRIALCEKWGIRHRLANDAGLRADQAVIVDTEGSAESLRLAAGMVRPRGKVVLLAPLRPGERRDGLAGLVEREASITGSRGGSVPEALALLQRGGVDVLSLITRRMRLDDGAGILRAAGEPDQVRVLVDMER